MGRRLPGFCLCVLLPGAALAQASASFVLQEYVFNSGGHPSNDGSPASASHLASLGSIGDAVGPAIVGGSSFRIEGNFVPAYLPPGEVLNLLFAPDQQTLIWDAERSAGVYNLYRDSLAGLAGLGYGTCLQQDIPAAATIDADVPVLGGGFFYLVTVENRLAVEGTKGFDGSGAERGGTSCP